jgi:DNA-binding MarR family transcriptional regulator
MKPGAELDALLLSVVRLPLMAYLKKNPLSEFIQIRDELNMQPGNLSLQIKKLKEAGYIDIQKSFKGNYPLTMIKLTEKGVQAMTEFHKKINDLLG